MFIGLTNFFDQSGPAVYFRQAKKLEICECPQTITPSTLDFAGNQLGIIHVVISILSAMGCLVKKKKKACLSIFFSCRKFFFSTIFNFYFRENPRFRDKFQALKYR